MCVCVCVGGATLIFSDHSFGFKILNFNLFWVFSRKLIFRGVCWNCGFSLRGGGGDWASSQNWTMLNVHFDTF